MNYYQTFIQVAEDCPVQEGVIPITKEGKRPISVQAHNLWLQS